MSAETRPISPHSFSLAITDLPLENIYTKAHEITNSIAHLQQSNKVLQEYSDSIKEDASLDAGVRAKGDRDCIEAIRENEVVIGRQKERVRLLKGEVERRGQRWHEVDPDDVEDGSGNGTSAESVSEVVSLANIADCVQAVQASTVSNVNGNGSATASASTTTTTTSTVQPQQQQSSGRLTDEELRRQIENMLPDDGDGDNEGNEGMHL